MNKLFNINKVNMIEICVEEFKKLQLNILDAVHDFCIENDIKYSLSFGSLLGAVRHKGFIPWDDDIDIMMLRKDYDKFIKSFNHEYISVIDANMTRNYWHPYAKIQDTRTVLFEYNNMPQNIGVNIDLFPVDNFPDNYVKSKNLVRYKKFFNYMHQVKIIKTSRHRVLYKNIILKLGQLLLHWFSMPKITSTIDNISKTYNNCETSWVGIIAPTDNKIKWRVPSSWFSEYTQCTFENKKFNIISHFSEYLDRIYGNWKDLPPLEKRISHHAFKAYWI